MKNLVGGGMESPPRRMPLFIRIAYFVTAAEQPIRQDAGGQGTVGDPDSVVDCFGSPLG